MQQVLNAFWSQKNYIGLHIRFYLGHSELLNNQIIKNMESFANMNEEISMGVPRDLCLTHPQSFIFRGYLLTSCDKSGCWIFWFSWAQILRLSDYHKAVDLGFGSGLSGQLPSSQVCVQIFLGTAEELAHLQKRSGKFILVVLWFVFIAVIHYSI